jgi:O-antigen ligase
VSVLTGQNKIQDANFSTVTFFSNAVVAWHSFKSNPLFGSGLGSHELSYDKFINKAIDVTKVPGFANAKDANSLFFRLMSETGLFGLVFIFIFIVTFYLKYSSRRQSHLWVINNASLSMIALRLVRQGHYFVDGFFFFIWLYYFSKIASRQEEELKNDRHHP